MTAVNLCNSGDLPFSTTGRHRRVRRADVEALRTRTQRMTRDQLRSLWLNHAVASNQPGSSSYTGVAW